MDWGAVGRRQPESGPVGAPVELKSLISVRRKQGVTGHGTRQLGGSMSEPVGTVRPGRR